MTDSNPATGALTEALTWWRGLGRARQLFALGLLLTPCCLLLWRDGRNLTLLLAGLPGLWFGFRVGFLRFTDQAGRRWLWLVWAFLGVAILAWGLDGFAEAGSDRLDRYNRLLFFLPWLITLVWLRPPARLIWMALGLGGIAIGVGAVAETILVGEGLSHRVAGDAHAMSFGIISALFATLLLGAAWQHRSQRGMAVFLLAGAILALAGMVLTGVRSGPVGFAAGVIGLALLFAYFGDRRGALLFAALPLALVLTGISLVNTGMASRFLVGLEASTEYFSVERRMPVRGELGTGCMNHTDLLGAWRETAQVHGGPVLWSIPDRERVAACLNGPRLRINSGDQAAAIWLPRSVPYDERRLDAVIHLRGSDARLRLPGGEWVHASDRKTRAVVPAGSEAAERLIISIEPGGWIELVPEAVFPGEYRYPHVRDSMGQRLEMWRIALEGFIERPLLGQGTGRFRAYAQARADQGLAAPYLPAYQHAHSEYFETLLTRGAIGLASLLLLLAGLVYISLRRGPGHARDARHPGLPFAALWIAFAAALLTEASLSMNLTNVTVAYFMALALYLGNHGTELADWSRNRLAFWRE